MITNWYLSDICPTTYIVPPPGLGITFKHSGHGWIRYVLSVLFISLATPAFQSDSSTTTPHRQEREGEKEEEPQFLVKGNTLVQFTIGEHSYPKYKHGARKAY